MHSVRIIKDNSPINNRQRGKLTKTEKLQVEFKRCKIQPHYAESFQLTHKNLGMDVTNCDFQ